LYENNIFLELACNHIATHSIQSLVEISNSKEEKLILHDISSIEGIEKLFFHNHGCYVAQKLVTFLEQPEKLTRLIMLNFKELAISPNGLCVIKSLILANITEELKEEIIKELLLNFMEIANNCFGNYIIQFMLEVILKDLIFRVGIYQIIIC
jgi:hypothetical protein